MTNRLEVMTNRSEPMVMFLGNDDVGSGNDVRSDEFRSDEVGNDHVELLCS